MLVTPFQVSFVDDAGWRDAVFRGSPRGYNKHVGLFVLNAVVDLSFFVDILCLFNQAYFDRGWVVDRCLIARRYARWWFWVDALSVMPYELLPVPEAYAQNGGFLQLVKVVRLLKLARPGPRLLSLEPVLSAKTPRRGRRPRANVSEFI